MSRSLCFGLFGTLALAACGGPEIVESVENVQFDLTCSIPLDQIFDGGVGVDGIPALTNPDLVEVAAATYLRPDDRVMGLVVAGQPIAVPLNILWWHEVVNLDLGLVELAVTHCPLTGSSLVFDRSPIGGASFGVSGLLYNNNLMMYDRAEPVSLWPQMVRGARCGRRVGQDLPMYPSIEMEWAAWQTLHPGTRVVSSATGWSRDYQRYPYDLYDVEDNPELLFPMPSNDPRRLPKERVLGIVTGTADGVGLPFGELDSLGAKAAVHVTVGGEPMVVLWNREARGAMAFETSVGNVALTFAVVNDVIVDNETGSTWRMDGLATGGPLAGEQLAPVAEAFVAFWFAWAWFYSDAELWLRKGPQ